jgi:chromate transporter
VNEHLLWNLFSRFLVISLAAFGGGKAALPLIERISVAAGWVSPQTFAASVGFGYVAPGPVLILATFIGYQAAGVPGAVAATVGVFLAPTLLAGWAAAGVERLAENRWLRTFGAGAAPAVVGLFGATAWSLARASVTSWPLAVVAAVALVLASRTKIAPAWLLLVGSAVGWGIATQK